eukprot:9475090-Pyramimonas_sp.AAC.1
MEGIRIFHFNVHNHNLTTTQLNLVSKVLAADMQVAQAEPLHNAVVLHDDMDFASRAPPLLHQPRRPLPESKGQHARSARWSQALRLLTEISSDERTHNDRNSHS